MTLSATWNRAKANTVLAVTSTRTAVLFEDSANGQWVVDVHSTLNSSARLIARGILKPDFNGSKFSLVPKVYIYPDQADQTYNPASLSTATAGNFSYANGILATDQDLDLDAFYTAAGVAKTDS